jgi:hypothetical protein
MTKAGVRIGKLSALGALAAVAVVPLLWGCDALLGPNGCNLVGCDTGVTVAFSGAVPTAFESHPDSGGGKRQGSSSARTCRPAAAEKRSSSRA